MEDIKKRGSNYTPAEKDMLLEIIKKHQNIIENKQTNGHMILKKREAWDLVTQQYNVVAVSGNRTWRQLRHLYENLKQRSKKNIAKDNRLQFYENTKDIQRKASLDKKELNRTGGGAYKSILNEQDTQILAMVAPQIQPLPNPYDDATLYFGDTTETKLAEDLAPCEVPIIEDEVQHASCSMRRENKPCTVTSIILDDRDHHTSKPARQLVNKPKTTTAAQKGKKNLIEQSCSDYKVQYFKTKASNAVLERKYLINKNKREMNIYNMEMKILRLKLQKLEGRKH